MFKQQVSPRTIHPYQTTIVSRSDQQLVTAVQNRIKYPWVDANLSYQVNCTDSSTSDPAYHVPQYSNNTIKEYGPPSPVYQSPYVENVWNQRNKKLDKVPSLAPSVETYNFPQCTSAFSLPSCDGDLCAQSQIVSRSPVPPIVPESPEVPIIGACGGHCPGFEYVCYYILQVIFVVGILTGISLCIAGIVLRRTNRNGDLGVLLYIGCLASCVCGLLLGVQCCVRHETRLRKMRTTIHIPLQPIAEVPAQACPLLSSTLQHPPIIYRPTLPPEKEVTGVPWWRRNDLD
ncbi:hypothetical protein EVAR_12871_1 [Eumeta japonica]|uniref:Uncharacterized protein n=1 Tax=Eumeta variegata TaxID=151549 RepID=A0A4C1TVL8_EUMVA|nr:hypothetical protein EVAR_12871_1 [Eumeta japonica]